MSYYLTTPEQVEEYATFVFKLNLEYIIYHYPIIKEYVLPLELDVKIKVESLINYVIRRRKRFRVSVETVERYVLDVLIPRVLIIIIEHDVNRETNLEPLYELYVDIIVKYNLDFTIIYYYKYHNINNIYKLLYHYAKLYDISDETIEYAYELCKLKSRDDKELFFYLVILFNYLLIHDEVNPDVVERPELYLDLLNPAYVDIAITNATIRILFNLSTKALLITVTYIIAYAIYYNDINIINKLQELCLVDKYHLEALKELRELRIISEEEIDDHLSILSSICSIVSDFKSMNNIYKHVEKQLPKYEDKIPSKYRDIMSKYELKEILFNVSTGLKIELLDKLISTIHYKIYEYQRISTISIILILARKFKKEYKKYLKLTNEFKKKLKKIKMLFLTFHHTIKIIDLDYIINKQKF